MKKGFFILLVTIFLTLSACTNNPDDGYDEFHLDCETSPEHEECVEEPIILEGYPVKGFDFDEDTLTDSTVITNLLDELTLYTEEMMNEYHIEVPDNSTDIYTKTMITDYFVPEEATLYQLYYGMNYQLNRFNQVLENRTTFTEGETLQFDSKEYKFYFHDDLLYLTESSSTSSPIETTIIIGDMGGVFYYEELETSYYPDQEHLRYSMLRFVENNYYERSFYKYTDDDFRYSIHDYRTDTKVGYELINGREKYVRMTSSLYAHLIREDVTSEVKLYYMNNYDIMMEVRVPYNVIYLKYNMKYVDGWDSFNNDTEVLSRNDDVVSNDLSYKLIHTYYGIKFYIDGDNKSYLDLDVNLDEYNLSFTHVTTEQLINNLNDIKNNYMDIYEYLDDLDQERSLLGYVRSRDINQ